MNRAGTKRFAKYINRRSLGLGSTYRGIGIVAQALSQHQEVVDMFHKSLDIFTELGGNWWLAHVLTDMSRSVFAMGDHTEARRVWLESLCIATDICDTGSVG